MVVVALIQIDCVRRKPNDGATALRKHSFQTALPLIHVCRRHRECIATAIDGAVALLIGVAVIDSCSSSLVAACLSHTGTGQQIASHPVQRVIRQRCGLRAQVSTVVELAAVVLKPCKPHQPERQQNDGNEYLDEGRTLLRRLLHPISSIYRRLGQINFAHVITPSGHGQALVAAATRPAAPTPTNRLRAFRSIWKQRAAVTLPRGV